MRTFDITPDGKQIVFDRLREDSNIVLIVLRDVVKRTTVACDKLLEVDEKRVLKETCAHRSLTVAALLAHGAE
jgi:hypothetical protein